MYEIGHGRYTALGVNDSFRDAPRDCAATQVAVLRFDVGFGERCYAPRLKGTGTPITAVFPDTSCCGAK